MPSGSILSFNLPNAQNVSMVVVEWEFYIRHSGNKFLGFEFWLTCQRWNSLPTVTNQQSKAEFEMTSNKKELVFPLHHPSRKCEYLFLINTVFFLIIILNPFIIMHYFITAQRPSACWPSGQLRKSYWKHPVSFPAMWHYYFSQIWWL